ncbi:hypothetical protein [Leisingera daeponensis]|uniref:hypothetical protein n=1 Tax=Leisingera daeponensis TaxID=405746 RepID=UPI001C9703A9|nr:hypothetical protein [Leisingera daeponensis]MBY6057644.1 hypothetical protein [Leisingera daeponensis]
MKDGARVNRRLLPIVRLGSCFAGLPDVYSAGLDSLLRLRAAGCWINHLKIFFGFLRDLLASRKEQTA